MAWHGMAWYRMVSHGIAWCVNVCEYVAEDDGLDRSPCFHMLMLNVQCPHAYDPRQAFLSDPSKKTQKYAAESPHVCVATCLQCYGMACANGRHHPLSSNGVV